MTLRQLAQPLPPHDWCPLRTAAHRLWVLQSLAQISRRYRTEYLVYSGRLGIEVILTALPGKTRLHPQGEYVAVTIIADQ